LVVIVCLIFQNSNNLSSAYGMAVSGVMLFMTFCYINVMMFIWKTKWWKILPFGIVFVIIDGSFLGSTLQKFTSGGWLPVSIGTVLTVTMVVWRYGSLELARHAHEKCPPAEDIAQFLTTKKDLVNRSPGLAVFFADSDRSVSPGVWKLLVNFHVLPSRAALVQVKTVRVPFVAPTAPELKTALSVKPLGSGLYNVQATYGYAQADIDAKTIVTDLMAELNRVEGKVPLIMSEEFGTPGGSNSLSSLEQEFLKESDDKILYIACHQMLLPLKPWAWSTWKSKSFWGNLYHRIHLAMFNVLARNATKLSEIYEIPPEQLTEVGTVVAL